MADVVADPVRSRIVLTARRLFMGRGYSQVTMAEMAAELGMSKKTLYQYFTGKEALLLAVIDGFFDELQAGLAAALTEAGLDFPARLRRFLSVVMRQLGPIQTNAFADIQRSAPDAWAYAATRRHQVINTWFGDLLRAGVASGMVRADLDPRLIIGLLLAAIERIAVPETLEHLNVRPIELFQTLTTIVFEGILTDTARPPAR